MDAAHDGHRLHGDDREPAVRLDAVRQSDRRQIRMDQGSDSGCLRHFRPDGDLAGSHRGLPGRPLRAATRRDGRRPLLRHWLGIEFVCGFAGYPLLRGGDQRHWCRRGLWNVRRQCAQVVFRPPRAGGRPHGSGLRRRVGADHPPDHGDHKVERLRIGLPLFRHRPGIDRVFDVAFPDGPTARQEPRASTKGGTGLDARSANAT